MYLFSVISVYVNNVKWLIFLFLSECSDNSDCKDANKGVCDATSKICQCDSGYVLDGSTCVQGGIYRC